MKEINLFWFCIWLIIAVFCALGLFVKFFIYLVAGVAVFFSALFLHDYIECKRKK